MDRRCLDWVIHCGQRLGGDPAVVPRDPPEIAHIAGSQERQIRLTNGDILRGRVRVQFLVPRLQKVALNTRPVPLANAIVTHDVQDAHPDVITVASPTRHCRQRHSCEQPARGILGRAA